MQITPFRYVPSTPDGYRCSKCGASSCKLWRQYQTLADNVELLCGPCALKDQGCPGPIDDNGQSRRDDPPRWGDQIKWLVPAVPTEDGDTFWGYTSVPRTGVLWWKLLPSYPVSCPSPMPNPHAPCGLDKEGRHRWSSRVMDALTCELCSARMVEA